MDTSGMWYIERGFENVVCSCNFVICTVKYTHTCALGTGFKLVKNMRDYMKLKKYQKLGPEVIFQPGIGQPWVESCNPS